MNQPEMLLRALGIRANLRGFQYLRRATELAEADQECLLSIVKSVYETIAQEFENTPQCVERNIRTAIDTCWFHGNRQMLNQIAGYELKTKPTNAQFIDIISAYDAGMATPLQKNSE